jgi:hypothetical protein
MAELGVTRRHTLRFIREHNARRAVQQMREEDTPPTETGRVPRVARLMALAIRFEHLLEQGAVRDQTELAELGHVTRARVTQIMNLLHLAPDVQEELLDLSRVTSGKDPIAERHVRRIAAEPDWGVQRSLWRSLKRDVAGSAEIAARPLDAITV